MIRRLLGIIAAVGLVMSLTTSAGASAFDPQNSYLGNKLGAIPLMVIPANPGTESLVSLTNDGSGGHIITVQPSVFQTSSFVVNSAAFTGFPQLTGLKLSLHSGSGSFEDGFSAPNSVGTGSIGQTVGYRGQRVGSIGHCVGATSLGHRVLPCGHRVSSLGQAVTCWTYLAKINYEFCGTSFECKYLAE